jgi:hypothetical protein
VPLVEPQRVELGDTRKCHPALLWLLLRQRERKRPPNRLACAPTRRAAANRRAATEALHGALRAPLRTPVAGPSITLPRCRDLAGWSLAEPRRWQAGDGPSSPSGSLTRPP